jgi:carbonic anhydrase
MNRKLGPAIAFFVLWVACGLAATAQKATALHFDYTGDDGPGYWWEESPACGSTGRQSPIDIDRPVVDSALGPLGLHTTAVPFRLNNNGHTVMATPGDAGDTLTGDTLTLNGQVFTLAQFHFHTLAEHTVSGRRGVLELHVVFQNSPSNLAVIGVLYTVGHPSPFLQRLLDAGLPPKTDSPAVPISALNIEQAFTDLTSYYTYAGSLTTPPCSETVTWTVLKEWAELSPEQYEAFRKILGNDFRPIQKTAGRTVRVTAR